MKITAAVKTHTGYVRSNNEDNYYLCGSCRSDTDMAEAAGRWTGEDRRLLFAVADGMGGEEKGELASLLAVKALEPCRFEDVAGTARVCFQRANDRICEEVEKNGGRRMGSTVAALYVDEGKALGCNIGDSRIYLLRDHGLLQISTDHNMAAKLVEAGVLTPKEARRHRSRHELTQHLGIFEDEMKLEPAVSGAVLLQPGDVFLLCSDGLTDMLTDEEIKALLLAGREPWEQAQMLVKAALKQGGRDNVTVLVVHTAKKRPSFRSCLRSVLSGCSGPR